MKKNKLLSIVLATTLSLGSNICEAKETSSIRKYLRYGIPAVFISGVGLIGIGGLGAAGFGIYKIRNSKNTNSNTQPVNNNTSTNKASESSAEKKSSNPVVNTQSESSTNSEVSDTKSEEDIGIPDDDSKFCNWVKLLAGQTAEGFIYKSGKEFRSDNDDHLEGHHNYIQLFFPNELPSAYSNEDLCIQKCYNEWDTVLKNNPKILPVIQNELRLNLIRILKFWKLDATYTIKDGKVDISNIYFPDVKNSILSQGGHNDLRATRVLYALRLFGLNKEHELFLNELNKQLPTHPSHKYWNDTKQTGCLTEVIKKYKK